MDRLLYFTPSLTFCSAIALIDSTESLISTAIEGYNSEYLVIGSHSVSYENTIKLADVLENATIEHQVEIDTEDSQIDELYAVTNILSNNGDLAITDTSSMYPNFDLTILASEYII